VSRLAPILQGFFTDRLTGSGKPAHTIAAYRDGIRLLLAYANRTGADRRT
jgi:integrase/recombinase XerD